MLQILNLEVIIEDLLYHRSNVIAIDRDPFEFGLLLPSAKGIAHHLSKEVAEHGFSPITDRFGAVSLSAQVAVVLQQFTSIYFTQGLAEVASCVNLVPSMYISFANSNIADHLHRTLQVFVIEFGRDA